MSQPPKVISSESASGVWLSSAIGVSLFFLLTTPLLQFAPMHMDHYNFHTIGDLAGTQMPYALALLTNLVIAGAAGLMFQMLWRWRYSGDCGESSSTYRNLGLGDEGYAIAEDNRVDCP